MKDYTKTLPTHIETYIGENDLFLEIFEGEGSQATDKRPPLLFVHGAYTGSWMWSKYIPHFISNGWKCYVMNMRSHYKSRQLDMTKITFEDYLEDIKIVIAECEEAPIVIGFSMGGILAQKLAESTKLAGLVLIDSSICREVHDKVPYEKTELLPLGNVLPAPIREDNSSLDESADDIAFQRKYLGMESVLSFCSFVIPYGEGISVDSSLITCPCLVVKVVNSDEDDRRGMAEAEYFHGDYVGLWKTTHTGLLVGQRYMEVVDRMLEWFKRFN
jgi:pimeloyl-ACP methyl ester carboxylesterase